MADLLASLNDDSTLIPARATVLVALSGGGDSLALLHLLCAVAPARRLEVHAAHFDHAQRGDSSIDADRARDMAAAAGVPFRIGRASGLTGSQAQYRDARLAFLQDQAEAVGADRIALAHQLEDQIETLALRLLRGTGLRGLGGIPSRRGRFVRPLLSIRRERLRAYLVERGLEWVVDPSNEDPRYARGRIRHDLLPRLNRVAGRGVETPIDLDRLILELGADARRLDAALDARALHELDTTAHVVADAVDAGSSGAQIARFRLSDYDPAVLARILRILARNHGFRLTRGGTGLGVAFIRGGSSGQAVDLGSGLRLAREYDEFCLFQEPEEATAADLELEIELVVAGSGAAKLGGRVYEAAWGDERAQRAMWKIGLDSAAVSFPLRLRGPRPGDRIRTRAGSRKLKKLLNERRVPRSRRAQVPVLEGADGRVLWVAGHETVCEVAGPRGAETFFVGVGGTESDGI